ncbi:senescence-associated carboxylesterase 101 isoform X2 [Cicer arietinum]|uniref:Senescence-associated carboxylesterase 101 isoform X2 n=1 Tax=Cicer arietinum TaxID=3827 RepID=A0A1S3DXA1_CICAR|nr:senescence-associated carboxylesterase 101 isoform X2 [Cicer arietinum]
MVQSQLFSSGIELAPFVTNSNLLRRTWKVITSHHEDVVCNVGVGLSWKIYKEPNSDVTIIAFEAIPSNSLNLQDELVSSTKLKEKNFLHFEFLCTKKIPFFSLNNIVVSLFCENYQKLDQLKSEINSCPKLIITGHALGGSIASLFTLLLLDTIDSKKKKPLCITFGSPLIGDKRLQEAISHSSTWNSCFLNVVSCNDPLPRKFIKDPHTSSSYMPFGTFLMCYDTYSTCFENHDSILALLENSIHDQNQVFHSIEYGNIVESLYHKSICKDIVTTQAQDMNFSNSLHASICFQLGALGLTPYIQQIDIDIINLMRKIETLEKKIIIQKRGKFDQSRKLNLVKIDMAQLEWYKKNSKNRNIGYYDSYKKMYLTSDHNVVQFQKNLTNYWKKMVEESSLKPQQEDMSLRIRWLYGGTTYRRMVEPLDIAQYYVNGGKDYVTKARSRHYKQLEDWLIEEATTTKSGSNKVTRENVESILTLDSCFWAHVEEALISCKQLKGVKFSVIEKEDAKRKLVEFENYVYGLLMEYAVSPEIFLSESSYMEWWNDYKEIKGTSYSSSLTRFMSNAYNYNVQYVKGTYNFG